LLITLSNTLGDKEEWRVVRAMGLSVDSNESARAPVTEELENFKLCRFSLKQQNAYAKLITFTTLFLPLTLTLIVNLDSNNTGV